MPPDDEDDRQRKAILDLARAEAHLREALLARRVEGVDDVAAATRALAEARERFEAAAHPRPRTLPIKEDSKSWGSH